jgi:hypothetical protein
MTDELDKYVGGGPVPQGPAPVASGAGVDELDAYVGGGTQPPSDQLDSYVMGQAQSPKSKTELFTSGLARNWAQIQATIPSLKALYKESQGDMAGAIESAKEAQAIMAPHGESEWNLQKIHSPSDFSNWFVEKMGEQGVTMLSMMATGGVGGLTANVAARSLLQRALIGSTSARALTLAGSGLPTYALSSAMETAGTSQEQFEVTGSTQPGMSIGFGMSKGLLELYAPMSIARALITPGRQLGKSLPGAIFKLAVKEGSTELAQEAIDIYARKLSDPNYSYFKDGPTLMPEGWGEGMWRLTEAGAAGTVVGGAYGAPFARSEQRAERKRDEKGELQVFPGDPAQRGVVVPPPMPDVPENRELNIGPVAALRRAVMRPDEQTRDVARASPRDPYSDGLSITAAIAEMKVEEATKDAMLDLVDGLIPRYVEVGGDPTRIWTDTEIERETSVDRPQSVKPRWTKVNQGVLQPAAITAQVTDLPPPGDPRVYFLPDTSPEDKTEALRIYERAYSFMESARPVQLAIGADQTQQTNANIRDVYGHALNLGLRVVPTRGAGFYYNGVLEHGPETEVRSTGRSEEVLWYVPETRQFAEISEARPSGGVLVSVDRNRLRPEDYTVDADGAVTLAKDLDVGDLIPGIAPDKSQVQWLKEAKPSWREGPESGLRLAFDSSKPSSKWIGEIVQKYKPQVDRVLRNLGVDKGLFVGVMETQDNAHSPGTAYLDQGVIVIRPIATIDHQVARGLSLEEMVADTLMHEVGHFITFQYFSRVTTEQQQQLLYAWEKAVMAGRLHVLGRSGDPNYPDAQQQQYWLTFTEWLAEQFRRWAGSAAMPVNELEQTYKQGARRLESYFREWEKKVGTPKAMDLTQPDYYFSAFMEYIQGYKVQRDQVQQKIKQWLLHNIPQDVLDSPVLTGIANTVTSALQEMQPMMPPGVQLSLANGLETKLETDELQKEAAATFTLGKGGNLSRLEIALGALDSMDAGSEARTHFAHEVMHAVEQLGLITPEEIAILTREARANEAKIMNVKAKSLYRAQVREWAENNGVDRVTEERVFQQLYDQELRAYYVQQFANGGEVYSAESRGILSRLLEMLERIANKLRGLGYQSRNDVLRAFFKGEISHRGERNAELTESREWQGEIAMAGIDPERAANFFPQKRWRVGELTVGAFYEDPSNPQESPSITYHWTNAAGELVGVVTLEHRGPKGHEVVWVQSDGFALSPLMLQEAEKDLGQKFRYAGMFTEEGFKQAQIMARLQGEKGVLGLYRPITIGPVTFYVSPNYARGMFYHFKNVLENPRHSARKGVRDLTAAKEMLRVYATILRELGPEVWNDPRLERMFSLRRQWERDEVQASMMREGQAADEAELLDSLGMPAGGSKVDAYRRNMDMKLRIEQGKQARRDGLPFDLSAPPTMMSFGVRKMMEWAGGHGHDPRIDKHLNNRTAHEMDRIGWFTKYFWSLQQLAWKNEHIVGLKEYNDNLELMNQVGSAWLRRADQTAKLWKDSTTPADREAIANVVFDLTEMRYRSQAEVQAKVVRFPDGTAAWQAWLAGGPVGPELRALFTKHKLKQKHQDLIRQIHRDFADFLTATELTIDKNLQRTFRTNAVGLQQARAKLAKDMAEMRAKPYFPMVRFGEYIISVRDPLRNNKVVWSSAYGTLRERDAAFKEVRRQHPGDDITVGKIPLHSQEFAGLPPPMLAAIKENMLEKKSGMTAEQEQLIDEQLQWLEQFEMLNSPDRSFRKRWMPAKGLPGYSLDAHRAYAHYFTSGARYLSRLAFMHDLRGNVQSVIRTATDGGIGNWSKRMEIGVYMRKHLDYILEGGRDSGKFRAFVALWMLGFSPAAAFMNLTQPITATYPYLAKVFGDGPAFAALSHWLTAVKAARGKPTGSPTYERAREEMVRQGFIDIGQAPELAGFAEGNNLIKMMGGTVGQRTWQGLQYWGMKMFGATEHFNRELTMRAAWDLAIRHPQAERLQELDAMNLTQAADLQTRLGFTHQEALAFLFAKEAIQRTQFAYDRTSDPPFMRGKAKDLLIFFKYMQSMTYLFGGHWVRMSLIFMFLYGLKGLPGSEDLNELLRLLSRKLFGKDFDLHKESRAFVRDVTRGGVFDEMGPDLFLHGISRYGFGLGMLPNGWAAPRFDASANGSMGKLVPGFAEVMHGVNTGRPTADVVSEAAQKASGAGYGLFFSLFHYAMEPASADSKKWEQLLQRELKALAKVYRYAVDPGAETNRQGAKLVKFNATDPDDILTIIAQGMGFQPRKVAETWEMLRAVQDEEMMYKTRRSMLYVQFDKALTDKDAGAVDSVIKAIQDYNEEVLKIDPSQAIKPAQLQQSLKERNRQRQMMELTLSRNRGQLPLTERIMDQYPGVKAERVK